MGGLINAVLYLSQIVLGFQIHCNSKMSHLLINDKKILWLVDLLSRFTYDTFLIHEFVGPYRSKH